MPTPKKADASKKKATAPKNALSKPVQPDAALAAVIGKDPLPRTELTKKLWEYIRKHELQDPKEKRNIRADDFDRLWTGPFAALRPRIKCHGPAYRRHARHRRNRSAS